MSSFARSKQAYPTTWTDLAESAATLVVGPSWVGDMVMANALFRRLVQNDKQANVDVLAPAWSLPVVGRMPEVRRGIAAETAHGEFGLGKRRRIGVSLRGQYDRAIVLPRSLKSALVPWFARIPQRTGFRGESRYGLINDMRAFDRGVLNQTVKRYVALADAPQAPALFGAADVDLPASLLPGLATSHEQQAALLARLSLSDDLPVIGMMPGAEYGPAKCWPLRHFHSLAIALRAQGYAVWILGSEKDAAAGEEIAKDSGAINLCGRTSLEDVIDALAVCEQVVTNDSGLMHIAAAVGTHVHGIYGSSSPDFTPPLTANRDIHTLSLECSPCFKRQCPLQHLNCLNELSPDAVLRRIVAKSA